MQVEGGRRHDHGQHQRKIIELPGRGDRKTADDERFDRHADETA